MKKAVQRSVEITVAVASLVAEYAGFRKNNPSAPFWWDAVSERALMTSDQRNFIDNFNNKVEDMLDGVSGGFRDGVLLMLDLCDAGEARQGGCTMRLVDGFYVFTLDRDTSVRHQLKVEYTCAERLAAHWEGFRLNNQPAAFPFRKAS